jgi:hypothetical protein
MTQINRVRVVTLMVTILGSVAQPGTLRKVWDYDIAEGHRSTLVGVFALRFSRDGQRIAAVVGSSSGHESVLVLDSRNPGENPLRLQNNPGMWEQEPGAGIAGIEWSLSGRHVILAGAIVNVSDGKGCSLPGTAYRPRFSGSNQVVAYETKPSRITFFDLECQAISSWDLPEGEFVEALDASPERGLLFVTKHKISNAQITEVSNQIFEISSKKVLRQFPTWRRSRVLVELPLNLLYPTFTESGKAFCGMSGEIWDRTVACSAVDTGHPLGVSGHWSDPNFRTAARGSRVVISDYSRRLDLIDLRWYPYRVHKRAVWDYASGKEIAQWIPRLQNALIQSPSLGHAVPQAYPYRFDISADGDYIVEGGASTVSLYRIEP